MTSLGFVCWLAGRHPRPGLRMRGPAPDDCRRMIPGRQDRRAWTTVRPRPGTGNLIFRSGNPDAAAPGGRPGEPAHQRAAAVACRPDRSEEHTSELQSLMRISDAVFRLNKKYTIIMRSLRKTSHVAYL